MFISLSLLYLSPQQTFLYAPCTSHPLLESRREQLLSLLSDSMVSLHFWTCSSVPANLPIVGEAGQRPRGGTDNGIPRRAAADRVEGDLGPKGVSSSLLSVPSPMAFRAATTRWEAQPEGRILGNTDCPPRMESRRREKLQLPEGSTNGCAGTTPRGWGRFRN